MEHHCSSNRASEAPRAGRWTAARLGLWLCAELCAACSTSQPKAVERVPVAAPAPPAPTCPRLPLVARMWTGFAADVPPAPLHLTLDVVAPIREALGTLFCPPERAACRPAALQSIELTDVVASAARVQLVTDDAGSTRVLELRELAGSWQAEPESLAAFLAVCRARNCADAGL
jgi:hypothetical protein